MNLDIPTIPLLAFIFLLAGAVAALIYFMWPHAEQPPGEFNPCTCDDCIEIEPSPERPGCVRIKNHPANKVQ